VLYHAAVLLLLPLLLALLLPSAVLLGHSIHYW
jgi:hypothetical protein